MFHKLPRKIAKSSLALIAGIFAVTSGPLFAEEAVQVTGFVEAIQHDPFIIFILFLLAVVILLSIERVIYYSKDKGDNEKLTDFLMEEVEKSPNDIKHIIEGAKDKTFGMEGRVAARTLAGWRFGTEAMKKYSEAALAAESRRLDRFLVVLSTLGNNIPFVGLLGTVLGIMKAFGDLATQGDQGPAVIMVGISAALWATAWGLGAALPAVFMYNALNKTVKNRLSAALEIVDVLVALRASYSGAAKNNNGTGASSMAAPEVSSQT